MIGDVVRWRRTGTQPELRGWGGSNVDSANAVNKFIDKVDGGATARSPIRPERRSISGGEAAGRKAAKAFPGIEHEPAYHADSRSLLVKAVHKVAEYAPFIEGYQSPAEDTVMFTTGAIEEMLRLRIKNARK